MNPPDVPTHLRTAILVVRDLPGTCLFYGNAFDWQPKPSLDPASPEVHDMLLEGGPIGLVLSLEDSGHTAASPATTGCSSVTLVMEVPDVDAAVRRFVLAGGTLRSGPSNRAWGVRAALVQDPEGHRWMLQTPLE